MTGGRFGKPPSWYALIKAANYLHVPPWELEQKSVKWTLRALAAISAEAAAQNQDDVTQ